MATSESSSIRVLRLPELLNSIVQCLDPRNIHKLRLVNTFFLDQCSAHFSITLDLENERRHSDLKKLAESTLATEESAAMTSTGETDETNRKQSSSLDVIQSLKINRDLKYLTPEIVSILNQCRNLRHIFINVDPRSTTALSEKQSYPARLLWSSMFPVVQGEGGGGGGRDSIGSDKDEEQHWTFWDLLPLEGLLFDRLETLKIDDVHNNTQLNLERFMTRLGRSRASKSLRTLTITSTYSKVSWETFRDCICNLTVLKTLCIHSYIYTKDPLAGAADGSQCKMATQLQKEAPTVTSLTCRLVTDNDPDVKLAIMRLFPNVESLDLYGRLELLLDTEVEERIFSKVGPQLPLQQPPLGQRYPAGSVESNNAPSHQIPFPLLKSMACLRLWPINWSDSKVLRHWTQRAPNFRFNSLYVSDRDVENGLHEELSAHSVSLQWISILVSRKDYVKELLSSRLCRNLEVLRLDNRSLDCSSVLVCLEDSFESTAVILDQAGSAPPSRSSTTDVPLLRQHDLFARFPWTLTLTAICFQTLVHSSSGSKVEIDRSVAFLSSFLKLLPRLVDFEVVNPIMDLSVFDGLGRQSTASDDDPTDAARLSERPWLTRIKICQSQHSKDRIADSSVPGSLAPWRDQLLFQFRFLETLDLERELVYTGYSGCSSTNFGIDVN